MGLTHVAAAELTARLTPDVQPDEPKKLERGHARGKYVDRSRTDRRELRGISMCGKGMRGCMPHHAPGDPVAYLERMAKDDAERDDIKARLKLARARFKRP